MFVSSGARRGLALSFSAALAFSLAACGGSSSSSRPSTPPQTPTMLTESFVLNSPAVTAHTPGSPGVTVTNQNLITQFGGAEQVNMNRVRYTRYALSGQADRQPDAIMVAIPGTLGNAHNYWVLAENLMTEARDQHGLVVEVWGVDRRSVWLQDRYGLKLAEQRKDLHLALDFLFGAELGLPLSEGLSRRAFFHDFQDVPFMAEWTPQVHSIDIDQVVNVARETARDGNVFLAGHSAGTRFAARYAATDFNISGTGTSEPGYAKLRGLVLFEGIGGQAAAAAPTPAQLDALIAAADGGMYQLAADGSIPSYIFAPGLTPRVAASSEISGMQMAFEGTINGTQAIQQQDQLGIAGNNAHAKVADFTPRAHPVTAGAGLGLFMDDDNTPTPQFYSISMGAVGPEREDGLVTWLDSDQDLPAGAFRNHGPAPTMITSTTGLHWGQEVEATSMARLIPSFFQGDTNFSDWYYPSTGLLLGNAAATGGYDIGADLGLDTSAISLPVDQGGRGRPDIVNQIQARNIDIPVIGFGGSNGLTPVAGMWAGMARIVAPCAAPSCVPGTPRLAAGSVPFSAFPDYGGPDGGFEVYISEGYTHMDVLTANNDETNNVVGPLLAFLERNVAR